MKPLNCLIILFDFLEVRLEVRVRVFHYISWLFCHNSTLRYTRLERTYMLTENYQMSIE